MTTLEKEKSEGRSAVTVDLAIFRRRDGGLARAISNAGSPPVLTALAIGLTATTLSQPRAWLWAGLYVLIAVLTPFLYLAWLVRKGKVTDLDVQLREQRKRPLLVTLVCMGVAGLLLALGPAPSTLTVLAVTSWLQVLAILGITLRWKISVHASAAAGAGTVIWALLGSPWPLFIGVPIISWSRVRLRRHTLLQTAAGALLGWAFFWIADSLM